MTLTTQKSRTNQRTTRLPHDPKHQRPTTEDFPTTAETTRTSRDVKTKKTAWTEGAGEQDRMSMEAEMERVRRFQTEAEAGEKAWTKSHLHMSRMIITLEEVAPERIFA